MDTGTLYAYIRPSDSHTNRAYVYPYPYLFGYGTAPSHVYICLVDLDAPPNGDAHGYGDATSERGQDVLHQPERQR